MQIQPYILAPMRIRELAVNSVPSVEITLPALHIFNDR